MFRLTHRTITLSLLLAGLGSAAATAPANATSHHGLLLPAVKTSLPAVQNELPAGQHQLPAVQDLATNPAEPTLLLPAVQSAREAARR